MLPADTYLHKGLRQKMCVRLIQKGITDRRVIEAMNSVPRHWFLDSIFDKAAYEDRAIHIDCEQTMSRPATVATQSMLLKAEEGMKVLEIGTGSGYQAAVLCQMGLRVFTIERQKSLFERTRARLKEFGYNARCFLGDGYKGLTEVDYHPYDRIIITCGAREIPSALMAQLKTEGIMVIPLGVDGQQMKRITKHGDAPSQWEIEDFGEYNFVPMLDGKNF